MDVLPKRHIPTDPTLRAIWNELRRERFAHRVTLERFRTTLMRLTVRDATSQAATRMCILCRDAPSGVNPERYRKDCVHHLLEQTLAEHTRLGQPIDNFAREFMARLAAETETPPVPNAAQSDTPVSVGAD